MLEVSINNFNHTSFWNWCRGQSKNNIIIISEFNVPNDFKIIWQKERVISLDKNTGNKKDIEKLCTINNIIF